MGTPATVTLADYATSPKQLVAGFAKVLQDESPFMDAIPFANVGTLAVEVMREGSLPNMSSAWRKIGATPNGVKADAPTKAVEQAYALYNAIDVDKILLRDQGAKLYNPMTYQAMQIGKSIAREFNDAVINNTPTASADKPVGLWWRVQNDMPSAQRVTADPAGGSSGLDISPDGASLSSNIVTLIDKLDVLLSTLEGGKADVLLMNSTMKLRLTSALRQSNMLSTVKDKYDREFEAFKGARIVDMGLKYDDSSKIIGNVETLDGTALTTGTGTSIYAVKFGPLNFTGFQLYSMEVSDPTLTDDGVTYRSIVDWVVGIALSGKRSLARLYGIIAA